GGRPTPPPCAGCSDRPGPGQGHPCGGAAGRAAQGAPTGHPGWDGYACPVAPVARTPPRASRPTRDSEGTRVRSPRLRMVALAAAPLLLLSACSTDGGTDGAGQSDDAAATSAAPTGDVSELAVDT